MTIGVLVAVAELVSAEPAKPAFSVGFENGFDGKAGEKTIEGGRAGNVALVDGRNDGKAAYLHFSTAPGDALYYRTGGKLLNRFMGTADCWIKVGEGIVADKQRHIVIDLRDRSQTGYLLELGSGRISFSSQRNGNALTMVAAQPKNLGDGQWHRITAVWHTASLRLYVDGKKAAESEELVIPSGMGQEIFLGSCYDGINQLEGALDDVQLDSTCQDVQPAR